jgi:site-specific recombinase XerD
MEVNTARKKLLSITGLKYANQIEKKHIIFFKDSLIADGLSVASIQKQISLLKAVFEVAVNNDQVEKNPFIGVKLVKPKGLQKPRIPFSSENIQKIFNSPVFADGLRPVGGAGDACVWLPYIALWTGMRMEEIGQLFVSDIRCDEGIYYISVGVDEFCVKQLKTKSSQRRIHTHSSRIG